MSAFNAGTFQLQKQSRQLHSDISFLSSFLDSRTRILNSLLMVLPKIMSISVKFFTVFLILGVTVTFPAAADPILDKLALLEFISLLPHRRVLNWSIAIPVCNNWIGVTCSEDKTRVVSLHLPAVGLIGEIPPNTLGKLTALKSLSLRSNNLTGYFPSDLTRLVSLTDLHLQQNAFFGPLPQDFSLWKNLSVLDLSSNGFSGSIPASISNLTRLAALDLSKNSLSGRIPNLRLPNLKILNVSFNHLVGNIPPPLTSFPRSSFNGNNLSYPSESRKLSAPAMLGIIVGGVVLGLAILAGSLLAFCYKKNGQLPVSRKLERSPQKSATGNASELNALVFFDGCNFSFDLEDLLRASAEVLGKGTIGTSYKAILEDSTAVVVKRLKNTGAGKREFEQLMATIGMLKHENIVDLRAYYYSKDEKLMVYDYFSAGSVSSMLHGRERTALSWESRMLIAEGAARGIAHLHAKNIVHGNIKSSNVFVNRDRRGCVSEGGLSNLSISNGIFRSSGYRDPELADHRKATQISDVYSFGVFLLELLTGKSPVNLVRWVQSVVREEWTAEVFDQALVRCPETEDQMVEMLRLAMICVAQATDQRPRIADVVDVIESVIRAPESDGSPTAASTC